jgi:hypothetical protein
MPAFALRDMVAGTMSGPFAHDTVAMVVAHQPADVSVFRARDCDPVRASIGSNLLQMRTVAVVHDLMGFANDPIAAARVAPVARFALVAFIFLIRCHLDLPFPPYEPLRGLRALFDFALYVEHVGYRRDGHAVAHLCRETFGRETAARLRRRDDDTVKRETQRFAALIGV